MEIEFTDHYPKWSKTDKEVFTNLVKNRNFQNEVIEARKEAGIVDKLLDDIAYWKLTETIDFGLPIRSYLIKQGKKDAVLKIDKAKAKMIPIYKGAETLLKKFSLPNRWWKTLEFFIAAGYGFPPEEYVSIETYPKGNTYKDSDGITHYELAPEKVAIFIKEPISKAAFIKQVEENWERIKELFNEIPENVNPTLTERDFFIIKLKDEDRLPYKEIADRVVSEFSVDDEDGRINAESMKTAYHSAKKRIKEAELLLKHQNKNLPANRQHKGIIKPLLEK
jgi:hypothetical protein